MTNWTHRRIRGHLAFTLIELLIVIAIIAVLAALIFPAGAAIKRSAILRKAKAELHQMDNAIEGYKDKLGHYPPDNAVVVAPNVTNFALNQLYYELLGTEPDPNDPNYFRTLDSSARIQKSSVATAFATASGFVNYTRDKSGDSSQARAFLTNLKPGQYAEGTSGNVAVRILTSAVNWPNNLGTPLPATFTPTDPGTVPNPWRYNSSNPVHNPNSFDLWVDVLISGKTNRISNWSDVPQVVGSFAYP